MDAGRQTGACHLPVSILRKERKRIGVVAAHAQELRRCQMRTRAKEGGQHEVIETKRGDMSPPFQVLMLSCHLVWLGKVGPK